MKKLCTRAYNNFPASFLSLVFKVQGSLFPIYIQITMWRTIITLNLNRRCRTKQPKRLSECFYTYSWIILIKSYVQNLQNMAAPRFFVEFWNDNFVKFSKENKNICLMWFYPVLVLCKLSLCMLEGILLCLHWSEIEIKIKFLFSSLPPFV